MKTSQYILISFFVFIFGAIFILYADAKSHKNQKTKTFVSEKNLKDFHTIVAGENSRIEILNDSVNTISTEHVRETPYNFANFRVSNDTLFISKSPEDLYFTIRGKSIKAVCGKKDSRIDFKYFYSDSLNITLLGGNIYGSLGIKSIDKIDVTAKDNARLHLSCHNELVLSSINVKADNSKISISANSIKALNASLKNSANLQTGKSEKLQIEADKTSGYTIMEYRFLNIKPNTK